MKNEKNVVNKHSSKELSIGEGEIIFPEENNKI